ncbi:MAG TPA: class I SAM-dependent methyltransferase [Acidobacteriaceae bacterium]|jgi:hypothetical protein|nr:class I SAM-dependent methyltransferase [Acidobacteriaceae bacterium]
MARRKPAIHPPAIHPFDQLHGTDTSGLLPCSIIARGTQARPEELTAYYGIAPSILRSLLDLWLQRLRPLAPRPHPAIDHTVFLDVGAGKGRALLLASQHPFLRVEGIELNQQLAEIASANIRRWQQDAQANALAPIALHLGDATTHPLPAAPILAHLFHPFEARTLRRFLRHVEQDLIHRPRPFDLLYVNAEHDSLLDRHPAFKRLWIGSVPMSPEDHLADLAAIAQQKEYGSTGDELCAVYRYAGRRN